jgi:phosphatidate cytidylyltransferase
MLRTRVLVGAILIILTVGVLVADTWLAPWYPFLFVMTAALTLGACHELLSLLGPPERPHAWVCYAAVMVLVAVNWLVPLASALAPGGSQVGDPWYWISSVFAAVVLVVFLVEMAAFEAPGASVTRLSLTIWIAAYLGLLPCFLIQLRWLDESSMPGRAVMALAVAIFVPKICDMGAYFLGRFLGRHPMTPRLSPKKTWEGAGGGLLAAVLLALALHAWVPVARGGWLSAVRLGLALGLAGMLGDLAESLIKRDRGQKDASQVVPGFGGILDVVDSIVFAAPVAYWWLK